MPHNRSEILQKAGAFFMPARDEGGVAYALRTRDQFQKNLSKRKGEENGKCKTDQ